MAYIEATACCGLDFVVDASRTDAIKDLRHPSVERRRQAKVVVARDDEKDLQKKLKSAGYKKVFTFTGNYRNRLHLYAHPRMRS